MTRTVVLLARAPSAPGKSRLTSHLAHDDAVALRRALFLDTLDRLRSSGEAIAVCYTPADAGPEFDVLVADIEGWPQVEGDLGARMAAAIDEARARGAHCVVLVGSDLPTLPARVVAEAFARLEEGHDLVLGPAEDGGYYLVGLRDHPRAAEIFRGLEWGRANVLERTRAIATSAGLDIALLDTWYDVDSAADLTRVGADPAPGVAKRTRAWIRADAGRGVSER